LYLCKLLFLSYSIAKLLFGEKPKLLGIFETLKKATVKNDDVHRNLTAALKIAKT
jgi:hypothetical protein